ncbi:MAG TPA: saccharopine dehydrogenase NADP-binding domain-containing protein, partial [Burkholderiales bacterium]|nr:saccharopine dehydrogenase NADP-binding domain-containing protein [Burkholderiales bacterium]
MIRRDYDLVLYGASGFTGRQAAAYLARHASALRWAMAGRDRGKLDAAREAAGAKADILVAEAADHRALGDLAARARVVISTAGPFALHGGALVEACVAHRTHYADITGETPWVRDLIERHHARATAGGTRLIPCCGFDSVPSDLGAWLVMRHLRERHGTGCVEVKAYYRMRGGFNGGTLASALNLQDSGQAARFRDPFLLSPGRHSRREIERNRDPEWISYDEAIGAWVGPYFMGPINTRVVRRSAALYKDWGERYGEDFAYQEYLRYDRGPAGWLLAAAATGAAGLFQSALASPA